MGNTPAPKAKHGINDQQTLVKQYTPTFEQLKKDPKFLINLINQNQLFATHLFSLFPEATQKFEAFLEMVLFLRKQNSTFTVNQFAKNNAHDISILDRFLMIVLKLQHKDYQLKMMNREQLDQLIINFFKLFVANPEKGSINKILKFLQMQGESFSVCEFTMHLKEYFPYADKFLKMFYLSKFKNLQKDSYLLKQFSSKIIKNDAILLALKFPKLSDPHIIELYSTQKYGIGFQSIYKQIVGYTGPWLLLVHHFQKNQKGQKQFYVFGSYQNGPIKDVTTSQGDVTGLLFASSPNISFFTTNKGNGGKNYFNLNSIPQEKGKRRKGFGFGGGDDRKDFKLWIDEDIDKCTVFNGKDPTYGFGSLANPATTKLNIKRMQIWGLGNEYNIQEQKEYWQMREQEVNKRRKVDKRQLLGNAELFFQKTFAHRSEVVGQIQKRQDKD